MIETKNLSGRAHALQAQLRAAGVRPTWLQVVVIWAEFEQHSVESNRTPCIQGKHLKTHLQALPPKLGGDEILLSRPFSGLQRRSTGLQRLLTRPMA